MAMKDITAAQWDAVAWAQGSFGVPDTAIAKIINCSSSTVRNARVKGGWDVRDLTKAHSSLTGWRQAEGRSNPGWGKRQATPDVVPTPKQEPPAPGGTFTGDIGRCGPEAESVFPAPDVEEQEADGLEATADDPTLTLERLTAALSRELNAVASGLPDAAALKRVDGLVAAAKTYEKLVSMKEKAGSDPAASGEALVVADKAKLLGEMDKRIDELAERRAKEIESGRAGPNPD